MTHEEYAKLGWFAQRRPSVLARRFRYVGREWARLGKLERSEIAHEFADFYEMPVWKQFLMQDVLMGLHERRAQLIAREAQRDDGLQE